MSKSNIFLLFIFLISFLIRFYSASNYPPLLWDEAAIGYNAYSLSLTSRDEYGQLLPIVFKSFGDFKPGFYIYLVVPFIKLFGLSSISVRLPSIIIGSLTPIVLFLVLKLLFPKNIRIAYLSAILITFNPFNVHFSRQAWETNVLTFQLLLASYLYFKFYYSTKHIYLLLSSIIFGLSLFTYQAAKLITPCLILILAILYRPKIKISSVLVFIIPLFILSLPIINGLIFSQDSNRLTVLSLFSYPRSVEETNTIISESNPSDYQIFHNQLIFFVRNFVSRYFNYFSTNFLIFMGDWQNLRHSAPYIGVLLYPSLLFLILGFFAFNKKYLFFLLWLLLAPVAGSLTRDTVTAVRTMSFSIPLIVFVAIGINYFLQLIQNYKLKFLTIILIFSSYFLSFIYYQDLYYNHMVKVDPNQYLYGYQQVIDYVKTRQNNFSTINITNFYGQPYIFYLFFTSYPPSQYQKQATLSLSNQDTGHIEKIDNITFHNSDYQVAVNTPHSLTIFSYDEILRQGIDQSPDFTKFIPLSNINGHSTFYAFEN